MTREGKAPAQPPTRTAVGMDRSGGAPMKTERLRKTMTVSPTPMFATRVQPVKKLTAATWEGSQGRYFNKRARADLVIW